MPEKTHLSSESLFLGVDGGQSHTKVAIGDRSGLILGRGTAGPCNHVRAGEGREKLRRAITDAVTEALKPIGRDFEATHFVAACFGMSGGPEDKRAILAELISSGHLDVTTDAAIALWGGTGGKPGVVVIAGTGSMALGINAEGRSMRAGGWGYRFGDEGGAYYLVRSALRSSLRDEEGWGPATRLRPMLLAATGAGDVNDLLHLFYTDDYPRQRIASLAPLLDQAAGEGDGEAARILHEAGQMLARYANAVRNKIFPADETVSIVQVGGVFSSRFVKEGFREVLSRGANELMEPKFDPAVGALLGAYKLAGIQVEPA